MVNVCVFGPIDVIKKIAKKGTESDLLFYNLRTDKYYTFITPNNEKFQSRLFCANLSHCAMIIIPETGPDLTTGEAIVILNALGLKGLIISPPGYNEIINKIAEGTIVQDYPIIPLADFDLNTTSNLIANFIDDGNPRIHVDHFFKVKSVGTVVLGTVIGGTINKYDQLLVNPIGSKITVKSLQVHDADVNQAVIGDRVGLSLKGIEVEHLTRGFVLSKSELKKTKNLVLKFTPVKFAPKLEGSQPVMVNCGLQYIPGKVTGISETVKVELEKELILDGKVFVARPELPKIKLVGHGEPV